MTQRTARGHHMPEDARNGPDAGAGATPATRDAPRTLTVEEYRALEAKGTTEEQFRRALRATARDYGFTLQYHTKFSLGSDPGFPDEVFLRDEGDFTMRCVVVECKRVGKEPTARQDDWLRAWDRVPGVEAYCWTAAMWDTIHEVLGRGWAAGLLAAQGGSDE